MTFETTIALTDLRVKTVVSNDQLRDMVLKYQHLNCCSQKKAYYAVNDAIRAKYPNYEETHSSFESFRIATHNKKHYQGS